MTLPVAQIVMSKDKVINFKQMGKDVDGSSLSPIYGIHLEELRKPTKKTLG
jgi:hypothetical protein